jgi:hypothetical protein
VIDHLLATSSYMPATPPAVHVSTATSDSTAKKPKKKRGRPGFFPPNKLAWLQTFSSDYIRLRHNHLPDQVSQLFNNVQRQWLIRYGYDLPLNEDAPVEPEPTPENATLDALSDSLGVQEIARRKAVGQEVRKVCRPSATLPATYCSLENCGLVSKQPFGVSVRR